MTESEVFNYALEKLHFHKLYEKGWRFRFDRARKRMGLCNYRKKLITISGFMYPHMTTESIKDTILHEIAHALCPMNGHDATWKHVFMQIGGNGQVYFDCQKEFKPESVVEMSKHVATRARKKIAKFKLSCPTCNKSRLLYRRPKHTTRSCRKCGGNKYNADFKMDLIPL